MAKRVAVLQSNYMPPGGMLRSATAANLPFGVDPDATSNLWWWRTAGANA